MLREVIWSEDRSYRTGSESEPVQFYMDGLCNSKRFDLLLGYFSSAAINVLSLGFASFLYKGGTVRMVVNNILSQEDKNAIKAGQEGNIQNTAFDLSDIKQLKRTLDDYGKHFFECLAWLIQEERIQIKIIRPKTGRGIAHYKSGAFFDGTDTVGFKASCNFTAFGLLENLEELDAFLSWENSRSSKMINRQNKDFENIFSGKSDIVEYLHVGEVSVAIRKEFGNTSLNELLIKEKELTEKKSKVMENKGVRRSFEKAITSIEEIIREPKFPFPQGPRLYQTEAYQNWVNNNFTGVFAMATGTGKTITSMNCILNEFQKTKTYKAIILVPTLVLVEQWKEEAKNFNFTNTITVSSKNASWKQTLTELKTKDSFGIATSYIVIATYKSFTSDKFQDFIKDLKTDEIFIADEAHNIGAGNVKSKLFQLKIKKRIALSATPKRVYDPEGTKEIENFFNDTEPYTYNFPMERAIEENILCKYYYFPKLVTLQEDEMKEYNEISLRIARLFQKVAQDESVKKQYENLLMLRKAIIHKAKNKFDAFKEIINSIIKSETGLKYSLVYAPEGYHSDDEFVEEEFPELDGDYRIIDFYANIVRGISPNTHVAQYTSESEDKENLLKSFENGKIDVLLSMKCLDEGVDVPRTEQAIFCSSTGNPRQFIQRRGRILRKHPDKKFAKIFDLVVIPMVEYNSPNFDSERKLVQKELERVVHFAYMAINKYEAIDGLKKICEYYDLNLDTIHLDLKN
ncbi:MAG: DEAD/DEAH box helicase family protein [Bacteroidetes bacterium]|nr:DEAD/DEAH box helicase family protein [Bacteroidota bacterium]